MIRGIVSGYFNPLLINVMFVYMYCYEYNMSKLPTII